MVSQSVPWYGSDFDERLLLHLSYSPRRCVLLWFPSPSPDKSMYHHLLSALSCISSCMEGTVTVNTLIGHNIILMCYRWACRICEMASGSLRPCDFKYSKLLASLQTFRCTYNFETRYLQCCLILVAKRSLCHLCLKFRRGVILS